MQTELKSASFSRNSDLAGFDMFGEIGNPDNVHKFIMSTSQVDRSRHVVLQDGWQLDSFKSNPIIAFTHDDEVLPIAKGVGFKRGSNKTEIAFEYDANDEFAMKVKSKVDGGFLNTGSVRFKPLAAAAKGNPRMSDEDKGLLKKHPGSEVVFKSQELIEFSVVVIPDNPGATQVKRYYDLGASSDSSSVEDGTTMEEINQALKNIKEKYNA